MYGKIQINVNIFETVIQIFCCKFKSNALVYHLLEKSNLM